MTKNKANGNENALDMRMSVSNAEKIKLFACKNYLGHKLSPHKLEVREMLAYKFNMPPTVARATGMGNQKNTFKCARRCRKKVNTFSITCTQTGRHTYTHAYILSIPHTYLCNLAVLFIECLAGKMLEFCSKRQSAYIVVLLLLHLLLLCNNKPHT